jgi:predicted RND superfamily exporter protein
MLIDKNHGTKTDSVLRAIAQFTINRKMEMLIGVVCIAALCLYYVPKIEADANVMNQFPKNSSIYKDAQFISDNFGGYSTLNILIEATHPVANDSPEDGPMKNPGILKWMEDLQKFALEQTDPKTNQKLIGDALSMTDFVSYMNRIMKNDPRENRVPDSRNLIAQYLLSYENQSSGEFSGLVDYKYNKAQIVVRLPDMSTPRLHVLIANLKDYIKNHTNNEIHVSFGGAVEINAELGTMIVDGQIWSLFLSVAIIIVCYMIFFRSFAAGMLAAVPMLCAITLVFGLMGILNIPLDYITATLTGISIGAGTDYTAYFLWRLRERSQARGNLEEGYIDTMTSIGKGILYNGLSVVAGFVVFLFSNFIPIRFFGFLISFSILACIVSTLTILPVVIFMVKPKFLLQGATTKGYDLEVSMRLPVQTLQAETQDIVRFADKTLPEKGSIGDQS